MRTIATASCRHAGAHGPRESTCFSFFPAHMAMPAHDCVHHGFVHYFFAFKARTWAFSMLFSFSKFATTVSSSKVLASNSSRRFTSCSSIAFGPSGCDAFGLSGLDALALEHEEDPDDEDEELELRDLTLDRLGDGDGALGTSRFLSSKHSCAASPCPARRRAVSSHLWRRCCASAFHAPKRPRWMHSSWSHALPKCRSGSLG